MKILYRYLYKKLTIYLLVIVPSFIFVAVLAQLVELLRKIKSIDYTAIILYSIFQIPEKIYYILPASTVIAFFLLARDLINSKEIYPVLLNGVSLRKIGIALFVFPAFISLLQIFNLEIVMPQAKKKAGQIYLSLKKQHNTEPLIAYNTWMTSDSRTFVYFSFIDLKKRTGKGISIIRFDDKFRPVMKIEGNTFKIGNFVHINNGKMVSIENLENVTVKKFKSFIYKEKIDTKNLAKLIKVKKPVSMLQLYNSAVIAEKFGYPSSYFWSRFYSNLSTVFSPLILSFAFYPLIWKRKKLNLVIIAVLLLVYWYATAFLSSISQTHVVPYQTVFLVDIIYIVFGILLFRKLRFGEL